jgi:hypothetical protein
MKNLKSFTLITLILVAGAVINASAQNKQERTSAARAAYGLSPVKHKAKKKHKANNDRPVKATREKNPAYRKKYNWAS